MARKRPARPRKKELAGQQYAALPLAVRGGEPKVMLVTSRETKRWVLPKGWAERGLAPHEVAAREALEEAGLVGAVERQAVGSYHYEKRLADGSSVACEVAVYPLWVERQVEKWAERGQRKTKWFTLAQAAMAVEEGDLITLLLSLAAPVE